MRGLGTSHCDLSLIHGRYQVIHQDRAGVYDFAADLAIDGVGDIAQCLADRDQFLGGAQVLVGVGVDEADDLLFPLADGNRVIRFLAKKS
ncbi:MAG TPA: hypothetical protein VEQ64_06500 [Xanthobacteraceae bacterium]|nr:hypothetical protein [Xanthobacteraceae bacterium]